MISGCNNCPNESFDGGDLSANNCFINNEAPAYYQGEAIEYVWLMSNAPGDCSQLINELGPINVGQVYNNFLNAGGFNGGANTRIGNTSWYFTTDNNGDDLTYNAAGIMLSTCFYRCARVVGCERFWGEVGIRVDPCTNNYQAGSDIFDFQARKVGRTVSTYWLTNTEQKNDYFIVERSIDGENFEEIDIINSFTDADGAFSYDQSDEQPALGYNYYRLRKIHMDGTSITSLVRRVKFDLDLSETALFPNPTSNQVYINLSDFEGRSATISIYNPLGHLMDSKFFDQLPAEPIDFNVSNYTGGVYNMYISLDGTKNFSRIFIVTKL